MGSCGSVGLENGHFKVERACACFYAEKKELHREITGVIGQRGDLLRKEG